MEHPYPNIIQIIGNENYVTFYGTYIKQKMGGTSSTQFPQSGQTAPQNQNVRTATTHNAAQSVPNVGNNGVSSSQYFGIPISHDIAREIPYLQNFVIPTESRPQQYSNHETHQIPNPTRPRLSYFNGKYYINGYEVTGQTYAEWWKKLYGTPNH